MLRFVSVCCICPVAKLACQPICAICEIPLSLRGNIAVACAFMLFLGFGGCIVGMYIDAIVGMYIDAIMVGW